MSRPKIRVLHVIKGLDRGGAERLLLSTIRNHGPEFEFEVVYFMQGKAMLDDELAAAGARITCLPVTGLMGWFLVIFRLVRFIRRCKNFDLIHAHLPVPGVVARFAGLLTGLPVVYTEHNLVNRYKQISRWLSRWTYRMHDQTIAVSQAVAESIQSTYRPSRPLHLIPNGVDTDEFNPDLFDRRLLRRQIGIPDQALVIGVVAVMTAQKRLDRWLSVAGHLAGKFSAVQFLVVGDGPLRTDLEKEADRLLQAGRMRFTGVVSRPADFLACMDIFMLTSDFEGLPVALLEAMSMGCVPVCSRVGGIPAILTHGENGFLVDASVPEEIAETVGKFHANTVERNRLGAAARQTILKDYSIRRMVSQLEELYFDVVKGNQVKRQLYV